MVGTVAIFPVFLWDLPWSVFTLDHCGLCARRMWLPLCRALPYAFTMQRLISRVSSSHSYIPFGSDTSTNSLSAHWKLSLVLQKDGFDLVVTRIDFHIILSVDSMKGQDPG